VGSSGRLPDPQGVIASSDVSAPDQQPLGCAEMSDQFAQLVTRSQVDRSTAHGTLRVLVVGAGFIGAHIARALRQRNHDVVILSRGPLGALGQQLTNGSELVQGDASQSDTVLVGPLTTLLDALGRRGPRPVTFISSGGLVYGQPQVFPTPETQPAAPASAYGMSRLTAERLLGAYSERCSVPIRVLRVANAYGPGQDPSRGQGVIAAALQSCCDQSPFILIGDGRVSRDFVHVADVAHAVGELVQSANTTPVLNVGSGTCVSMRDLLTIIEMTTRRPLLIEQHPESELDQARVHLDVSLLRSIISFEPRSLATGIADTWNHLVDEGRSGMLEDEPLLRTPFA
jgi:UDP-glucose 4-epimerase